ncbi:DUF4214 domain-containing protein [Methylobacterium nigriterrae]|uniref:DUF4214 domain-containing protein n=1 Tax=Methylobacterium nigriterrae TaxID=3127512 RepID=UPI0030140E43
MADAYSAPVSQILDNIAKNHGNPSSTGGLQKALENVLSKLPKGQDDTSSVQVQNVTSGEISTAPVVNVDTSQGFNVQNVSQSSIINLTGGGSATGTANSSQDQVVIIGDGTKAQVGLTGDGGATVQAGSGDSSVTLGKTGDSSVIGGTGDLTVNGMGSGKVAVDLTATTNATVSAGGGDDSVTLGQGSYNLNLGSGHNTVTTQAHTSSGSSNRPAAVAANSHDGYQVSVDGSNRIVLDDGQGHVSTLANVNVVQFSNGSTFVKASTADEAVIARMYEAVLNRTADSAGIYGWWDAYNSGQLSLKQVADSFLGSAEAQTHGFGPSMDTTSFLTNLYQNLLGRSPDTAGLAYWSNALNSGAMSRADVLIGLTASTEGATTNSDSVLFSTVSGAGQDHTPHNFDVIPDGSQTVSGGAGFDVVNFGGNKAEFTTSLDVDRVTVFNAQTASTTTMDHVDYVKFGDGSVLINAANADQAVIARMYDALLNRSADSAGLQYWWNQNESGTSLHDIAHSFLNSPEFQASSSNLSNTAFIDQLYHNMFGRSAEQGGLDYWNDQLTKGLSREDLVVNIAKSLEAGQDTADSIKIIDHTHTY